jgi:excisionase family DNA binding protein
MSRVLSPTESMARAFVTLRGADPDDRDALSAAVQDATTELQAGLADRLSYSKTEAAHLLDVSSTTLEKWIDRGLIPVVQVPRYKRDRIPAHALLALAGEVKQLRRQGRQRGLLLEALNRLEREDPQWQRQFDDLYGEGLRAMQRGDLVKVDLDSFGPDD